MPLSVLSFFIGAFVSWMFIRFKTGTLEEKAQKTLQSIEASIRQKREKEESLIQQKEHSFELSIQKEKEFLRDEKQRLKTFKHEIEEKEALLQSSEKAYKQKEKLFHERMVAIEHTEHELRERYEKLSLMNREMAITELLSLTKKEIEDDLIALRKNALISLQEDIAQKSIEALQSALERIPAMCSKECFLDLIPIEGTYDKVVPKLIGKDGRNIQTLEKALGVSISFDPKDKMAFISSTNSEARWIAKNSLIFLAQNDKITPARVLEEIESQERTLSSSSYFSEIHEKLASFIPQALSLDPEIRQKINRLYLSNSMGQNLFYHSLEVALLMHNIAQELSLSLQYMALTGLLHDIGKVLEKDWGDTHSKAGASFLQHYGISKKITDAILSHHGETSKNSPEAYVLAVADRISGGSLSMRKKMEGNTTPFVPLHKERLVEIEEIIKKQTGVISAWASFKSDEEHLYGRIEAIAVIPSHIRSEEKTILEETLTREVTKIFRKNDIRITLIESPSVK